MTKSTEKVYELRNSSAIDTHKSRAPNGLMRTKKRPQYSISEGAEGLVRNFAAKHKTKISSVVEAAIWAFLNADDLEQAHYMSPMNHVVLVVKVNRPKRQSEGPAARHHKRAVQAEKRTPKGKPQNNGGAA